MAEKIFLVSEKNREFQIQLYIQKLNHKKLRNEP